MNEWIKAIKWVNAILVSLRSIQAYRVLWRALFDYETSWACFGSNNRIYSRIPEDLFFCLKNGNLLPYAQYFLNIIWNRVACSFRGPALWRRKIAKSSTMEIRDSWCRCIIESKAQTWAGTKKEYCKISHTSNIRLRSILRTGTLVTTILLLCELAPGIIKKSPRYHVWKPNVLVLYLATLFKRAQMINETHFERVITVKRKIWARAQDVCRTPTKHQSHLAANPINQAFRNARTKPKK